MSYDPNQPRDPKGSSTGGQWTSTQIDTAAAAAHNAAFKMPVDEKLAYVENKLEKLDYERAYMIDGDNGDLLFTADGSAHIVTFNVDDVDDWSNVILIHNHPNSDNPFSVADVVAASITEPREIRVVCKEYTHIMRSGKGGWLPSARVRDIMSPIARINKEMTDILLAEIAGKAIRAGEVTITMKREHLLEINYRTIAEIADNLRYEYRREKRR